MKKLFGFLFLAIYLLSCSKPTVKDLGNSGVREDSLMMKQEVSDTPQVPVADLSFDDLIGKWLLLGSEGEIDPTGDHLLIQRRGNGYEGLLVYQGTNTKCSVVKDGEGYFVITERQERYKISRIESMYPREHNGIGLALIVSAFEDISLGFFQREDVLKRIESEGQGD